MLASRLEEQYRDKQCAVVAMNDGGVVVGAQIAARLHCVLGMTLSAQITLPRETLGIGSINSGGTFAYNHDYSPGEIAEFESEFRGYIEEQKLTQMRNMDALVGKGGLTRRSMLRHRNIILVADGIHGSSMLSAAEQFLKPLKITRLIVATPLADLKALDTIHVMADEIQCLDVIDDIFPSDHYFDDNTIPDHKTIVKTIENIVLHWH